jgi:hypothetical protein
MMNTKDIQDVELKGIPKSRCIWDGELFVAIP